MHPALVWAPHRGGEVRHHPCCQASSTSSKVAGTLRSIRTDAHGCKLTGLLAAQARKPMGGRPPGGLSDAQRPTVAPHVNHQTDVTAVGCCHRLTAAAARPLGLAAAAWDHNGLACILGAAFCFSWAATFVKLIHQLQPEITIFLVIAIRSALSVVASCAAARRLPLATSRATAPLLALRGLSGAGSMTLFYAALNR